MLYFPSMTIAQNEWSKSRVHEQIIVPNQLMDHLDKKKGTERWKLKMKVHKWKKIFHLIFSFSFVPIQIIAFAFNNFVDITFVKGGFYLMLSMCLLKKKFIAKFYRKSEQILLRDKKKVLKSPLLVYKYFLHPQLIG